MCCKLADCLELQLWQCCTCPLLKCLVTAVRAVKIEISKGFCWKLSFFVCRSFFLLLNEPACLHRSMEAGPFPGHSLAGLTACLHAVARGFCDVARSARFASFAWRLAVSQQFQPPAFALYLFLLPQDPAIWQSSRRGTHPLTEMSAAEIDAILDSFEIQSEGPALQMAYPGSCHSWPPSWDQLDQASLRRLQAQLHPLLDHHTHQGQFCRRSAMRRATARAMARVMERERTRAKTLSPRFRRKKRFFQEQQPKLFFHACKFCRTACGSFM